MSKHDNPVSEGGTPPLVTYSRVPRQRAPRRARAVAEPFPDERTEPHLTAAEVPYLDEDDVGRAPPPLRAANDYYGEAPLDEGIDPLAPPPRRRRSRLGFVMLIAVVAAVLGIGVLALTFGMASRDENPPTATLGTVPASGIDPARLDAATESGDTIPVVRTIPLGEEGAGGAASSGSAPESSTASAPVPPPVPRARPDAGAASTAPDEAPAEAAMPPIPAPDQPLAAAPDPNAAPESDDEFINRIERTLSSVPEAPARAARSAPASANLAEPVPVAPAGDFAPTVVPENGLDIAPPPGAMLDFGADPGMPLDLNAPHGALVPPADIPNAPANGFQ